MKKLIVFRIGILLILVLNICVLISYSNWARLEKPQSNALGLSYNSQSKTLIGNPIASNLINVNDGVTTEVEIAKRDIELNFLVGKFEQHSFSYANLNGVYVDYIDIDYLTKNSQRYNGKWFAYRTCLQLKPLCFLL